MINVYECITDDAKIYLTKDYNYRRSFFKRKDDELYIKEFNHAEFIGEQLCLIKNIKCAHYFLVGLGLFNLNYSEKYGNISDKNYQIKLASYNFKEDDKKYFILNGCNITSENSKLDEVLNLAVDDLNREELIDEIINMFSLDIFMGQQDRFYNNIMFEIRRDGSVHLAPLYDFEVSLKNSYLDPKYVYKNDLISFKSVSDLKKFISMYPNFKDELKSYLDINLVRNAKYAYELRNLNLPRDILNYLDEFQTDRKKLIKEIIN